MNEVWFEALDYLFGSQLEIKRQCNLVVERKLPASVENEQEVSQLKYQNGRQMQYCVLLLSNDQSSSYEIKASPICGNWKSHKVFWGIGILIRRKDFDFVAGFV